MTAKTRLPVEIFQSILESAGSSDTKTFSSLSLASWELCNIAQPYIFRKCSFVLHSVPTEEVSEPSQTHGEIMETANSRASSFLELARISPHLLRCIRTIEVEVKSQRDLVLHATQPTTYIEVDLALTKILLNAPNVRELLFPNFGFCFQWSTLPRELLDAISAVGSQLTSLNLAAVTSSSFPLELFLHFPRLKRLTVDSAVERSNSIDDDVILKHISLDYLEIGQAYVQDERLRWLYEDLDISQLKHLFVRGTLMDINPFLDCQKLTKLEWNMRYFGFETVVINDETSTPSGRQQRIPAVFQHLASLQELVIHGRLTIAPAHSRSNFPYITACLKTFPDNNQLSHFTLNLKVNRLTRAPVGNIDFDSMLSPLLTSCFARLERVVIILSRKFFVLGDTTPSAPVGTVIDTAFVDCVLQTNPLLEKFVNSSIDRRVKVVAIIPREE